MRSDEESAALRAAVEALTKVLQGSEDRAGDIVTRLDDISAMLAEICEALKGR